MVFPNAKSEGCRLPQVLPPDSSPPPSTTVAKMSVVVVNASRVDFDRKISWTDIDGARLEYQEAGMDPTMEDLLSSIDGAEVIVTKEIPVPAVLIERFPDSVKLIVEAGTGYNNIDLVACKQKGITVSNVPSYSGDAVATLVITFILQFSCGLVAQQHALASGDRSNFTAFLNVPHFELSGKTLGLVGGRGCVGSKVGER